MKISPTFTVWDSEGVHDFLVSLPQIWADGDTDKFTAIYPDLTGKWKPCTSSECGPLCDPEV